MYRTLLVLALVSTACASSGSDSDDPSVVINPVGNENESHIIVQLPTDACIAGGSCAKPLAQDFDLYVDGVAVNLGASTRVKPGVHNIAVGTLAGQVTTTAKQTLTMTLPIVEAKCTAAGLPNVPRTDFGASIAVENAACPTTVTGSTVGVPLGPVSLAVYFDSGCSSNDSFQGRVPLGDGRVETVCAAEAELYSGELSYRDAHGTCFNAGTGYAGCVAAEQAISGWTPGIAPLATKYLAYPPGTLTAMVNGAPQTLTVEPGDELDFNLSLPALGTVPATFATNISFLSPRTNADAATATIASSCGGDRSYTVPAGPLTALALTAFVAPACTYTLSAAGRTVTLGQTAANNLSLDRVDVNDVTVTREDGSTYTVKGAWTLYYGGVQVAGPFTTATGIDALPGTYELALTYTDFDGPQKQTQSLTL